MHKNLSKSRPTFKSSLPKRASIKSNQNQSKISLGRLTDKNYDLKSIDRGFLQGIDFGGAEFPLEERLAMRPTISGPKTSSIPGYVGSIQTPAQYRTSFPMNFLESHMKVPEKMQKGPSNSSLLGKNAPFGKLKLQSLNEA